MSSLRKNEDEKEYYFSHFENLPDVILFKIFSYLYIGDLCRAGRVCLRWYHLTRCRVLWKHVDAHDMQMTSYQIQKLVPFLPSCVMYLRICSFSTQQRIPFLSPHTAIEIRERCPQLKTLILESAFIAKHINFTDITVEDLPQTLSVLSLRKSFFHTDQFFCSVSHPTVPKIKVLDCSFCWCVSDNDIPFFSRLSDLQEIYLAGCPISDLGIVMLLKGIDSLKVLDLEGTTVGDETILSLNENCRSLEQLYLGNTPILDRQLCLFRGASLPMLHTLCLRNTAVSSVGLRAVIVSLHRLKNLNVTNDNVSSECILELSCLSIIRKVHFNRNPSLYTSDSCDHFSLRNNLMEC